jgi:hypothetical protein
MKIKDIFKEYFYLKMKTYDEFYLNLLINYLKKCNISFEIMDSDYGRGYFVKIYYYKKHHDKYIYSFMSTQDIINDLISYDINKVEQVYNLWEWDYGLYDFHYNFLNYIGIRNNIEKFDINGISIIKVTVYIKEFNLLCKRKIKIDKIKNITLNQLLY